MVIIANRSDGEKFDSVFAQETAKELAAAGLIVSSISFTNKRTEMKIELYDQSTHENPNVVNIFPGIKIFKGIRFTESGSKSSFTVI